MQLSVKSLKFKELIQTFYIIHETRVFSIPELRVSEFSFSRRNGFRLKGVASKAFPDCRNILSLHRFAGKEKEGQRDPSF